MRSSIDRPDASGNGRPDRIAPRHRRPVDRTAPRRWSSTSGRGGWRSTNTLGGATMGVDDTTRPAAGREGDEAILHRLGYAQVLYREMGGFSNFAISFTIISILAGCLTSYYLAFNNGGPIAITWGWLLVGAFSILVSMAMGEIASSMPTAGALSFWPSKPGRP